MEKVKEEEEEEVKVGLHVCLTSATRRCGRGVAIIVCDMPCGLDAHFVAAEGRPSGTAAPRRLLYETRVGTRRQKVYLEVEGGLLGSEVLAVNFLPTVSVVV